MLLHLSNATRLPGCIQSRWRILSWALGFGSKRATDLTQSRLFINSLFLFFNHHLFIYFSPVLFIFYFFPPPPFFFLERLVVFAPSLIKVNSIESPQSGQVSRASHFVYLLCFYLNIIFSIMFYLLSTMVSSHFHNTAILSIYSVHLYFFIYSLYLFFLFAQFLFCFAFLYLCARSISHILYLCSSSLMLFLSFFSFFYMVKLRASSWIIHVY